MFSILLPKNSQKCCGFEILNKIEHMNNVDIAKLFHFDEMFDNTKTYLL